MVKQRVPQVSEKNWLKVNGFNRQLVKDFLEYKVEFADKSYITYTSSLKIFFYWVYENLDNKRCVEIKKKEFIKYLNWLTNRGLSEAAIKLKKSVISSLCNYILTMYEDEFPTFRSFVTSDMKVIQTGLVYEKQPLTKQEYTELCMKLEQAEQWQILAWVKFTYSTGCRRAESIQLRKEIVEYTPIVKEVTYTGSDGIVHKAISTCYKTHKIRCKGHSKVGKVRRLQFSEEAMQAIKKWLEYRGNDDCPYVFVSIDKNGNVTQMVDHGINVWCSGLLTSLVGRRVHPHLFRESRATNIVVEEGKTIETAQKLLGHESSDTTAKHYIVREDTEDADEAFI
jgi:integrase